MKDRLTEILIIDEARQKSPALHQTALAQETAATIKETDSVTFSRDIINNMLIDKKKHPLR